MDSANEETRAQRTPTDDELNALWQAVVDASEAYFASPGPATHAHKVATIRAFHAAFSGTGKHLRLVTP